MPPPPSTSSAGSPLPSTGQKACPAAIEVVDLSKRFGSRLALDGVTFTLAHGEVGALVGPNGAGKTTLLRVLATLDRPTSGRARIDALDLVADASSVRRRIGLVGHQPLLYPALTVIENLRFAARLYGLTDANDRLDSALAAVDLGGRRNERAGRLSRGMSQRLGLARALVHDPSVLLLDEPYTGLDPHGAERLDARLRELASAGHAVLFTTHDLARAHRVGDRILLLARGRLDRQFLSNNSNLVELEAAYRVVASMGVARRTAGHTVLDDRAASLQVPLAQATPDASKPLPPLPPTVATPDASEPLAPLPPTVATPDASEPLAPLPPTVATPDVEGSLPSIPHDQETPAFSATAAPTWWSTVGALVWKDVLIEFRHREVVPAIGVFCLLVLALFGYALPLAPAAQRDVVPGVLWVALLFGATLGLSRTIAAEADRGGWTGLLVSPADRGALFIGKWLSSTLMGLVVIAMLLPIGAALFELSASAIAGLGIILALGLAGWTGAGTLIGAMANGTRAREVLLPVLLYPLVLPLAVPTVQAASAWLARYPLPGAPPPLVPEEALGPALVLVVAYAVVFLVLGFLLFPYVVED